MANTEIDDISLLRLNDCRTSTSKGTVDKGFPQTLSALCAKGLVAEKDGGYVITQLGVEVLKLNIERVHLPKTKRKKYQWRNGDDEVDD